MSTKDRILGTSLTLFNEEGEQFVTPVDIANALEISPGNLYYHFKGKDPIIQRLYADFEEEFRMVLRSPVENPLDLSDNWVYFYILFEEIADFRFFYRNLQSILDRYPDIERKFRTLVSLKIKAMYSVIKNMEASGFIHISEDEIRLMAERFALQLTYWPMHHRLMDPEASIPMSIHNGVYSIICQLTPFVQEGAAEFLTVITEFRDKMLALAKSKQQQLAVAVGM